MTDNTKIAIGLVGAGPWASLVHAPMFSNHPRTRLAGVWARRHEAALHLASMHGAAAFQSFDELLANCQAVVFSVPPDVQAHLAAVAAGAGKALLLEKPIALTLKQAEELAAAVDRSGVPTQVNLTWRYAESVRSFLDTVVAAKPIGARGHFISSALLGGPFATPWRLEHGPLLDLGPHVLDLLDAALGAITGIRCHGDPRRWVGLLVEHVSGVTSEVSLSSHSNVQPFRAGVEVYTREGVIDVDAAAAVNVDAMFRMAGEFADTVAARKPHALDVQRGLHLQRLLDAAAS
jgi:predicted dehydrogenase